MIRKLVDYTDIETLEKDTTNNVSLITLKCLPYLDTRSTNEIIITYRGVEFTKVADLQEAIALPNIENVFYISTDNKVIFPTDITEIVNRCNASDYVTGLVIEYPINNIDYTTGTSNATYDLKAYVSQSGDLVHVGKDMTINEVVNVIQTLDNKVDINKFGFNTYEVSRSISVRK